jgi:hypothetical protein
MVPAGTINLFVGFACATESGEARPYASGQLFTATLPIMGDIFVEDDLALADDVDQQLRHKSPDASPPCQSVGGMALGRPRLWKISQIMGVLSRITE